jgi:hypothetical protein
VGRLAQAAPSKGVGPAPAVDTYLAGAAIGKVLGLELDPFSLDAERRDGSAQPSRVSTRPAQPCLTEARRAAAVQCAVR